MAIVVVVSPYSNCGIQYTMPKKVTNSSFTIGIVVLSFINGMLMKLPAKVAMRIKAVISGLKPTSSKATLMTPMKIKPIAKTRMSNKTANTRKL